EPCSVDGMDTQRPKTRHGRRALWVLLGLLLAALAAYMAEGSLGRHGGLGPELTFSIGDTGPGDAPGHKGGHGGGGGHGHGGFQVAQNGGAPDGVDVLTDSDDTGDAAFDGAGDKDHGVPGLAPDGANGVVTLADFTGAPGDGGGFPGGG